MPTRWELYDLTRDFNETNDLAPAEPERLAAMIENWWQLAERHHVLPLDDRFRERFAENAANFHGSRTRYVLHAGMGHVPTEVAPDLRSRSYLIEAFVDLIGADRGVLIAHGDATSGYSLYVQDGRLVHDMNVGGEHVIVRSEVVVPDDWYPPARRARAPPDAHREPDAANRPRHERDHAADRRSTGGAHRDEAWPAELHLLVRPRHRP